MTDATTTGTALDEEVAKLVAAGWAVAYQRPHEVILSRRPPMTVWIHVLLALVTAGIWMIYVVVRGLSSQVETTVVAIEGDRIVQRFPVRDR